MPSTTWSTTDLSSITLDPKNLFAASTAQGGIRAAVGQTTGKYYFELTQNVWASTNSGCGIANASAVLATMGPTPTNASIVYRSGAIWVNNAASGSTLTFPSGASGSTVGVALDLSAYRIWFRVAPSGNWNGSGTADPATNVGGISISTIASASIASFPAFAAAASAERSTANFGATPFMGAVPSGFTAGYPTSSLGPQTNTVWSATDKTAGATVGSGSLGVIYTAAAGGVRSIASISLGKYYFEITGSSWFGASMGLGIANISAVLATAGATPANTVQVFLSGAIFVGNAAAPGSPTLALRTSGDVIAIALDMTAGLIWFRAAPTGNWNGSGTANPATGVGGVNISSICSGSAPAYALTTTNGAVAGAGIVANFGDSAFTGAVPGGFTSGFPPTSSVATGQGARVMVMA